MTAFAKGELAKALKSARRELAFSQFRDDGYIGYESTFRVKDLEVLIAAAQFVADNPPAVETPTGGEPYDP